jgi:hypothetical protein
MNRFLPKVLAASALALAALGVVPAAHAGGDLYFSIGTQAPPVYYAPPPVYYAPEPVYVQPRPVYVAAPVYSVPAQVSVQPAAPAYVFIGPDERARRQWRRQWYWRHHHDWDRPHWRDRDDRQPWRGRGWD